MSKPVIRICILVGVAALVGVAVWLYAKKQLQPTKPAMDRHSVPGGATHPE